MLVASTGAEALSTYAAQMLDSKRPFFAFALITALSAEEVSGTIVGTFEDGSSVSLSFSVPKCAVYDPGENPTCE